MYRPSPGKRCRKKVACATVTSEAILTAVADCIAQAGGDPEAYKTSAAAQEAETQDLTTQVLVVGTGIAGMTAALEARTRAPRSS